MPCEEIEKEILELHNGQLSPEVHRAVEQHLAECPECQKLAQELQRLDAELVLAVSRPVLPASFDQQLWAKIHATPNVLPAADLAERKQQLQMEFEARLAQIRRRSFAWQSVLDQMLWPAIGLVAGWLMWCLTPAFTANTALAGVSAHLLPGLAASMAFLGVSLAGTLRWETWKLIIFR